MDSQEHEVKLHMISQAGQVALEFLRSNPCKNAEEANVNYNKVFKGVYQGTANTLAE